MISIDNGTLSAKISEVGGELKSLMTREGKELMFQGWENFNYTSPLLFPCVGYLKREKYLYNNKWYNMGIHGILMNAKFDVVSVDESSATLVFSGDEETKKQYPFAFDYYITYTLNKNAVEIQVKVVCNCEEMYFSLGFHPAFKCDHIGRKLFFQKSESPTLYKLENGLINPNGETVELGTEMTFTENTFQDKALIFKGIESEYVTLQGDDVNIKMYIADYPYFALWSNKSEFVCLEPWLSTADTNDVSGEISEKPDVKRIIKDEQYIQTLKFELEEK